MNTERTKVFSYGGGRQTVALVVLISEGVIPRPDLIVMADTSREATATWKYLNEHIRPFCQSKGLPEIQVASHELSTVDLYGHNGDLLIPAYTKDAKLPTFCSTEWKRRVVRRWLRERGVKSCEMWMGFSWDEKRRASASDVEWIENRFPLIDLRLDVADCEAIAVKAGLPKPPQSSCWMCPHRRWNQWRDMKINEPDDFAKAAALEREINEDDEQGGVFLTETGKFLDEIDFSQPEPPRKPDPSLFRGCTTGFCWT